MEAKLSRDRSLRDLYVDFMRQYADLGHMTRVLTATGPSPVCYLPHHGVLREASSTTKLRVVFNGSATLPTGESLNRYLRVGPNLLPALADVLTRWRRYRFVLMADIEKMFRQIVVHPQDRDWQRILWRDRADVELEEFQLNTVTYGLACAPFLAMRTLRQLADDEERESPLGAAVLRRDVYMDDILTGASSIEAAKAVREQLVGICRAGGFPLRKWSANDASLLEGLPTEDRLQREPRWWLPGESHSTLGLQWHPLSDDFSFATRLPRIETFTRRTVLALTARLFDPLGWLSPATVRAKIWIQATWLLGIDWDTPLPDDDARKWGEFQDEIPRLEEIRIPRELSRTGDDLEIHGFADASEKAFAAVVYLRTRDPAGLIQARIVAAKTKVAPLQQVSLPRLELSSAALLVRLVAHVRRVLEAEEAPVHLWLDSTVALGWIRGHPSSWKTYVANRVSEIQTTLPGALWHHVPGRDNPADCASRGLSPCELVDLEHWWRGPAWLRADSRPWPSPWSGGTEGELPERRVRSHAAAVPVEEDGELELLSRCSTLSRLLRITAWCRRWLVRARTRTGALAPPDSPFSGSLRSEELDEARLCWVRLVQAKHFRDEMASIEKGKPLPARSALLKLSPILDHLGVLRVGGRLKHSLLSHDEKHP
ncbi:PREDICTED: uncharacterized protein LOC105562229, partial [Vollenhovia emeryi]|uniref:uncharacterized protein LOC105562229 n=1 Tax=Vollenhovia emeryi TaxID=411798 RepID=UPI0005F5459B